ncbi:MAG TPA: outer membrane protein assembly factor BamA [Candidatus Polarisedimenticolia bacterium]|nr:outer membrane protein assembly factor BamA [Candidatus Polarisedimenticolia bacterium]
MLSPGTRALSRAGRVSALARVLLAAALSLPAVPPALGQSEPSGEKVTRVLVEGNQRISDEAVLHLMTVKAGDPYNEAVLREEFKRIWARGLFEDLSIESRDAEGGKAIIVHVTEKPVVNSLKYDESKVISETQIEDALKTRNAQISIGEPVDYDVLKKAEEGIKGLLNQKGYLDAEVIAATHDTGGGNVEVRFSIEEGAKTRIRTIEFEGNTVFSDRRLKKVLKNTKEKGWFTRFRQKDIYHPLKLDTDLRELETLYGNSGYIDLDLPPAQVKVVEEKPSQKEGKSRKWVAIEQRVIEGRQYRLGTVGVTGNTVFPSDELVALMPLRSGDVLNESLVKGGLSLIDNKYGEKGYFYVSTNRVIDRRPEGVADVTVKVNEDRQYYLDSISFSGNLTTRDFVLRREMPLAEGDLFDLNKFRTGLRRISQLGYFQFSSEPGITPVEGDNKLKVTLTGTEPRRSELQVGGGYSGLDGGFFATSYQTRNFLGRGHLLSVNGQVGAIASRYQVNFTEPYLLGKPITAGFSLFRRDTDYVGFTTSGSGGSVTLGRRFRNFHNLSLSFLRETVDFDPTDGFSSTSTTASLRPVYVFDTRNNFYRPTRGFQAYVSGEYAGAVLGGENSFVKPQAEFQFYLPMPRKTYLAFHGEFGYIRPLQGDVLPTYERYFLGGERSLRNYSTRSVGPSGFICTFGSAGAVESEEDCPPCPLGFCNARQPGAFETSVVGGTRKALLNVEYVVPLSEPVDLVFYLDAGNAYAEWEPMSLSDFRGDAGVELRFFLPVFGAPLRLIYGKTLNAEGDDDTKSFLFSIGTTF